MKELRAAEVPFEKYHKDLHLPALADAVRTLTDGYRRVS